MDVFVHLLPDLDMAPLDFATINYISSDSLPPLIGTECVYRISSTMAISSHILLSDHFLVIHHFKRVSSAKSLNRYYFTGLRLIKCMFIASNF